MRVKVKVLRVMRFIRVMRGGEFERGWLVIIVHGVMMR